MSVYDKSGQRIYFQREGSTYGKVYDPETELTAFTAVPANYPHWRKLDYIPDTLEPTLPFIEKIKEYDISDFKHASSIANGNIEPVEITIDMNAQGLEFLMYAIGAPAFSSHTQKIVQTITCIDETSGVDENDYFLLDVVQADNTLKHYLVWFNNGTGSAPSVTGINAANRVEIDISGGDKTANEIALLLETALEALTEITACTVSSANCEITTVVTNGAVLPARNGAASPGFTYSVSTFGSTTYTVTEDLTTALPSFTIHLEQQNNTSAEDIIWDLFGCVIEEITVNVAFGDKIVKYSVTISCPYAVEGNRCTNPPGRKQIATMGSMTALQESASNYIIQEGTTDRTPSTVEKVSLTIKNNVTFQSDISKNYKVEAFAGKRDVSMNIVGTTTEKELFNYWQGAYALSGSDYIPSGASDKLNTEFKLQRDATYDYLQISVYNWLLRDHNFKFVNVDEAVKSVDMSFEDGTADSNGRILDSTTYVSYIDRIVMVV